MYVHLVFCLHPDGSDYTGMVPRLLTFDISSSEFPIAINIIDDNVTQEFNESFFCRLSTRDEAAILEPRQTTVRILDNGTE